MSFINNLYFKFKAFFSARWPKIFSVCDKNKSVVKFIFAGGSAAAIDLIFLYLFHGVFGWGLIFSTSFAFVLAFLVSFTLQKFWTFRNYNKQKIPLQLVLYLANAFIGLNLNGAFMYLLVNSWDVWYMLAQILVSMVIGFYNFFIYKFIVFKINPEKNLEIKFKVKEDSKLN